MSFLIKNGQPRPLGVSIDDWGINVAVLAPNATAIYFCVFDSDEREVARILLPARTGDVHHVNIGDLNIPSMGLWYGLRADGEYNPSAGLFYDTHKLLVDPYAIELNRSFVYDDVLSEPKSAGIDTAPWVPKAVFRREQADEGGRQQTTDQNHAEPVDAAHPISRPPQFIYELSVKAFTQLHPDVPEPLRGTVAALREPCVIEHLVALGVDTVELMPIAAWVNERHLSHLGLHNAWGYNPVAMMATEPRLCPGGWRELRDTVAALKAVGIQVILDVVFNHTGEGDVFGPILSMRGLDNRFYYKHNDSFQLINDTGCGNTIACEREGVAQLMVDTMRHWILKTGVAGFRFDLATVMGRLPMGFSNQAPLLSMMNNDPLLSQALLIAEPWDVGPGGYQLGRFESPWLEWNDKYRDDVRRYWQGQPNALGGLATRLAGSSDVFAHDGRTPKASVNFIAAHDGFCLWDVVSYSHKYNQNNGEQNRDGSNDNHSWSHGVEGELSEDAGPAAIQRLKDNRMRDIRALLTTLFVSQGTVMLTAGDELGRTQRGNNNAYAQDNEVTWIDWAQADQSLVGFVGGLSALRRSLSTLHFDHFLTGQVNVDARLADVHWWRVDGQEMQVGDWYSGSPCFGLSLYHDGESVLLWFNAGHDAVSLTLPAPHVGCEWRLACDSSTAQFCGDVDEKAAVLAGRSVQVWSEVC